MENWFENYWHFAFGFVVQLLFSVRTFVQWIISEKSKRVVSPVIYWQISLLASFLYVIYGWLRVDFAIIFGQCFSYYIYIWNLNILNQWGKIPRSLRYIVWFMPLSVIGILAFTLKGNIPFGLLMFGSFGQIIMAFRFIYQWWYSRKAGQSLLPNGFWILSIIGSISILIYGIIRKDPVLIIGQGAGIVTITYSRNLFLNWKNRIRNK